MVRNVLLFVSIDFQNVSASWLLLFIAIKRHNGGAWNAF